MLQKTTQEECLSRSLGVESHHHHHERRVRARDFDFNDGVNTNTRDDSKKRL